MLGKYSATELHPVSVSLFSRYPPLVCPTMARGGKEECSRELRNSTVFPSEDLHCVMVALLVIRQIEWEETMRPWARGLVSLLPSE